MSYILEAIKKAERERGSSLLPNQPVADNNQQESSSKPISWLAIAIFLNAVILLAWIIFQQVNQSENESQTSVEPINANQVPNSDVDSKKTHTAEEAPIAPIENDLTSTVDEKRAPEFLEISEAKSEPDVVQEKQTVTDAIEQSLIKDEVPDFLSSIDGSSDAEDSHLHSEHQQSVGGENNFSEEANIEKLARETAQAELIEIEEEDDQRDSPMALVEPLPIKEDVIAQEYISDEYAEDEQEIDVRQEPVEVAIVENPNVPDLGELPYSLQQEIPKIQISVHIYNKEKDARKVRINGGLFLEGQAVETDLVVKEITAHGVIFDYEGTLFKISLR